MKIEILFKIIVERSFQSFNQKEIQSEIQSSKTDQKLILLLVTTNLNQEVNLSKEPENPTIRFQRKVLKLDPPHKSPNRLTILSIIPLTSKRRICLKSVSKFMRQQAQVWVEMQKVFSISIKRNKLKQLMQSKRVQRNHQNQRRILL